LAAFSGRTPAALALRRSAVRLPVLDDLVVDPQAVQVSRRAVNCPLSVLVGHLSFLARKRYATIVRPLSGPPIPPVIPSAVPEMC
jgi:hypothetical protein